MAVKTVSTGVFKVQCKTCRSWHEYVYTDTYQRDGEAWGSMALKCPVCADSILHSDKNFITTR